MIEHDIIMYRAALCRNRQTNCLVLTGSFKKSTGHSGGWGNSEVTGSAVSVFFACGSVGRERGSDVIATYVLTTFTTCRKGLTSLTFGTEVIANCSLPKFYKMQQSRPNRNFKLTDDFQYCKVNILLFNTFSVRGQVWFKSRSFLAKANFVSWDTEIN